MQGAQTAQWVGSGRETARTRRPVPTCSPRAAHDHEHGANPHPPRFHPAETGKAQRDVHGLPWLLPLTESQQHRLWLADKMVSKAAARCCTHCRILRSRPYLHGKHNPVRIQTEVRGVKFVWAERLRLDEVSSHSLTAPLDGR